MCQYQQHKECKGEDWQQDSTVSDDAIGSSPGDIFGDMIKKKGKDTLRIGFQNIGGFPTNTGKIKEDLIRRGITKYEFDVFGCAETNVDWRTVKEEEKLIFRTKGWWNSLHLTYSNNVTMKPSTIRQFGGTALFSIDNAAHRAVDKGMDASKLGRWVWTRYRGKNNQTLRIVVAYRPNPPGGPFTVYAQHNTYFNSIGQPQCPRKAFLTDLRTDLQKFMEEGDHIILMIDGNSNMKQSDLRNTLSSLTLKEVILDKHGLQGPSTFRRNNTKNPIDGIWATPSINISAGGYFDYDELILNTDHRCLWIDISYITAFGHTMPAIIKPSARRLHCRDPRLVDNYVRIFKKIIVQHNLLSKVRKLKELSAHPLCLEGKQLYEEIDELRCKGVQLAERKCRKLRMGQVAYSPQLRLASRTIKAWSLIEKKAKGMKVSSRLLNRTLKKSGLPTSTRSLKKEVISQRLKEAYQDYYKIKGSSKELRASATDELVEALALSGNSTKEKIVKTIKHREKQKASARKIKFLRGKLKSGSTTMVTVQQADGTYKDLTGKLEIEKAIMENNKEKYQQSFHTPFLQDPLRGDFGFKGLTFCSQAVLGGVYSPRADIDGYTRAVIEELQMPENVRDLGYNKMTLDLDAYRSFWRKANENISCYPEALSFSTMKAGASNEIISELECELINCAIMSGYSPDRWKKFLDVMILKKSGVTNLSSLRTIVLFPVDCNFAFKRIGREMMKVAEATNSLASEQYGSRKNHRAIDLAVCKALTYDLLRQLKRPGAICSNDARSCYDLIGHSQASLAMQRNGVPRAAVDCLFTTLQEARHQVRTGYGDSYLSYGGSDWVTPMHGIGQGNGAGPAIWAVLSTPLLNLLRKKGFGCEFVSPISQEPLHFVGYAFVDDTDVIESKPNKTYMETASNLQMAVNHWEGGLKATCGAIVPEKTFWYLIDFQWSSGSWYYKSIADCPASIYINDINGCRKELRRCQVDDAQETLGVYLAPDGNTRRQHRKMTDLAIEWADCMRTGKIPKDDAWLAFNSTI